MTQHGSRPHPFSGPPPSPRRRIPLLAGLGLLAAGLLAALLQQLQVVGASAPGAHALRWPAATALALGLVLGLLAASLLRARRPGVRAAAPEPATDPRPGPGLAVLQPSDDPRDLVRSIEAQYLELERVHRQSLDSCRQKNEFMAHMSHEFRTPLNAIIGFSALLGQEDLSPAARSHLKAISDSAHTLLSVANDVHDLAEAERGELHVSSLDADLRETVDSALEQFGALAGDQGLELVCLFYEDVPRYLRCDPTRIRQVLHNLLRTAMLGGARGSAVLRVMVDDPEAPRAPIRITLEERGGWRAGMDPETITTALEQRDLKALQRLGSTGTALLICRLIARAMGGTLQVGTTAAGTTLTTFTFTARPGNGIPPAPLWRAAPPQCLVFEDHPIAALALGHALRAQGLEPAPPRPLAQLPPPGSEVDAELVVIGLPPGVPPAPALPWLEDGAALPPALVVSPQPATSDHPGRRWIGKPIAERPLRHALSELLLDGSRPLRPAADVPDLRGRRALIVDDNAVNRRLAAALLQRSGIRCAEAADGGEALRLFATSHFDVVLMDLHMPVMDGVEATRRLRAMERGERRTPVIAITAGQVQGQREQLARAGLDELLVKPVEEARLWRSLAACGIRDQRMAPATTPTPAAPVEEAADDTGALRMAGGNTALARELLTMFREDLPHMRSRIRDALEREDWTALEHETHQLHGAAACCGPPSLRAAAGRLEQALRRGETGAAPELHRQLDGEIGTFLAANRDPAPVAD